MRLSKSALFTYTKCPYSYYLHYELGYPIATTPEMDIGSNFHDDADKFFDNVSLRELADQTSMFGIERYIRSLFPEGLLYDHFSHIQTIHYMMLNKKEEFMPIERETKLVAENAPDYCLDVGIIDRIDRVDGQTILMEYKSGKFRQGINQELMMYKVLVEEATDYKIDAVCAIYPKELYGTKLPSGVYFKKPSHEKEARAKVVRVKQMIKERKWNDKKIYGCAWCGVADECFERDDMVVE